IEHFDGTNVTNFLEKYEAVAALHYDKEESFVRNFKYFCVPSLREEIAELASGNILNDILLKTPVEKKKSAKPSKVVCAATASQSDAIRSAVPENLKVKMEDLSFEAYLRKFRKIISNLDSITVFQHERTFHCHFVAGLPNELKKKVVKLVKNRGEDFAFLSLNDVIVYTKSIVEEEKEASKLSKLLQIDEPEKKIEKPKKEENEQKIQKNEEIEENIISEKSVSYDDVSSLTKHLSQLVLKLEGQRNENQIRRPKRCLYCDNEK
ncbi:hypothetical protein ROZALSC1DRAFT_25996, partial [Rozella allomycis CSF55]